MLLQEHKYKYIFKLYRNGGCAVDIIINKKILTPCKIKEYRNININK